MELQVVSKDVSCQLFLNIFYIKINDKINLNHSSTASDKKIYCVPISSLTLTLHSIILFYAKFTHSNKFLTIPAYLSTQQNLSILLSRG